MDRRRRAACCGQPKKTLLGLLQGEGPIKEHRTLEEPHGHPFDIWKRTTCPGDYRVEPTIAVELRLLDQAKTRRYPLT